jgi:AraC-like DNA-binding protein
MLLLQFPTFNIYGTPLLVLVLQGLIFFVLLLYRYRQHHRLSDLLLALILLITCWHQTTYTMAWYDTYRNTKVNYFLVNLSLAIGPLIYFYVRSVTLGHFRFRKKDYYHFIPVLLYILFKMTVYLYDMRQPGFDDTQNGVLMSGPLFDYVNPLVMLFSKLLLLLYLAFSIQHYYQYRQKIQQLYSNTYILELNWLRNFLYLYTFLFLYGLVQALINVAITDLSYIQEWWYYFVSALVIIYVGIKGYFTETDKLNQIDYNNTPTFDHSDLPVVPTHLQTSENSSIAAIELSEELLRQKESLEQYIATEKPYLLPDLNLIDLAKSLRMTRAQLSELINLGYQKNFNDFINQYRVDAVITALREGKQQQLSLLGIAYECGFNSKATFNRVFKKMIGTSPSEYLKNQGNTAY